MSQELDDKIEAQQSEIRAIKFQLAEARAAAQKVQREERKREQARKLAVKKQELQNLLNYYNQKA